MIVETNTISMGGTIYIRIPPQVAKFMGFNSGDKILIEDEERQNGIYLTLRTPQKSETSTECL